MVPGSSPGWRTNSLRNAMFVYITTGKDTPPSVTSLVSHTTFASYSKNWETLPICLDRIIPGYLLPLL